MSDFLEFFLPVLLLLAIAGAVFGVAYGFDRYQCYGFEKATGISTQYQGLECYALVGDKWVPRKYVFGTANELRIK